MGKYGDTAQSICNLQYKNHIYFPILANSTSGYNNHLLIPKMFKKVEGLKSVSLHTLVILLFIFFLPIKKNWESKNIMSKVLKKVIL